MSDNHISKIVEEECLINFLVELDLPDEIFAGIPYLDIAVPAGCKYQSLIPVNINILNLLLRLIHLLSKTMILSYFLHNYPVKFLCVYVFI